MSRFPMIGALLLVICNEIVTQAAHPFHVCVAQMEWNEASQLWEVSLRLHPQDLERVLSQSRKKSTSIEDRDFAEQAIPFLNKQFAIVHASKTIAIDELLEAVDRDDDSMATSQLRWVGMESERGWLWIHLEMIPPKETTTADQSWLLHRIFLDRIDRQENSVRIVHAKNRYALQFQRGQEAQAMKGGLSKDKDPAQAQSPGN